MQSWFDFDETIDIPEHGRKLDRELVVVGHHVAPMSAHNRDTSLTVQFLLSPNARTECLIDLTDDTDATALKRLAIKGLCDILLRAQPEPVVDFAVRSVEISPSRYDALLPNSCLKAGEDAGRKVLLALTS
jgi:hypothetical protein